MRSSGQGCLWTAAEVCLSRRRDDSSFLHGDHVDLLSEEIQLGGENQFLIRDAFPARKYKDGDTAKPACSILLL